MSRETRRTTMLYEDYESLVEGCWYDIKSLGVRPNEIDLIKAGLSSGLTLVVLSVREPPEFTIAEVWAVSFVPDHVDFSALQLRPWWHVFRVEHDENLDLRGQLLVLGASQNG